MILKRLVVHSLERLCTVLDYLPGVWIEEDGWFWTRHASYGCGKMRLAERSFDLDEKWETGVWRVRE